MSLFGTLMSKIFHHSGATAPAAEAAASTSPMPSVAPSPASATPTAASTPTAAGSTIATAAPTATSTAPGSMPAAQQVDVEQVLNDLARRNPEKLNWRTSIVDLMKLVGMDSSFNARKTLAQELGYTGDTNDSATMNIWLHKQVMRKIAENGGKVPQDMLH